MGLHLHVQLHSQLDGAAPMLPWFLLLMLTLLLRSLQMCGRMARHPIKGMREGALHRLGPRFRVLDSGIGERHSMSFPDSGLVTYHQR